MAVLQMQRISICALKKDRKQILEILQRSGALEVSDLSPQDGPFEKTDTSAQRSELEKKAAAASQALEILGLYAPEKSSLTSMFAGREAISPAEYETFAEKAEEIGRAAERILALSKQIAESKSEALKMELQAESLTPWASFELPLHFSGTRTTAAFIGSFPEELSLEEIYRRIAEAAPDVDAVNVDLISQRREMTCVMVVAPRKDAQAVEEALRACGFMRPASVPKLPALEQIGLLREHSREALENADKAALEIEGCAGLRPALRLLVDHYTMRAEKYEAIGSLLHTRNTFLLGGYIPAKDAPALERALSSRFDVAIELNEPGAEEDVPCALKNNGFVRPVEGVVESFGLPKRGEVDPSPIMAVFYYALFGLMFSDVGYGALLAIAAGILLLKFKNMEPGLHGMVKMFFFCGISTAAWGVVFSSYFGDVVDVVSRTFLGREISIPPLWFSPLEDPMKMLVFSMALGLIHLFTGLAVQLYVHLRARDWHAAFSKVIVWYLLLIGLLVYGLSTEMLTGILQLSSTLPSSVGSVGAVAAAIGAAGIVLTSGSSKNIGVRLAQGLYELYGATSYLGDILSYSRLLALGLATGVVGSVINQMGSMGGSGPVGLILFVLVFLIGHAINFGIELLGAYVHCNRLQFVEFFGKFYEGGGRKFKPFGVHTKYYKFKEDTNHG